MNKNRPAYFAGQKRTKNGETHPEKPEKGETGCVLGAGGGSSGWRRMKLGEKTWKRVGRERLSLPKHGGNRRTDLSRLPARVLLPGGERPAPTEAAAETGSRQSATGTHSPLGTRFWSGCGKAHWGNGGGAVLPGFQRKSGGGRCWFGAMGNFPGQNGRKRAGNPRKNVKYY